MDLTEEVVRAVMSLSRRGQHHGAAVDHDDHAPFVLTAGGLMNGADVATALSKGAAAGQLGTAFLVARECATDLAAPLRKALISGRRGADDSESPREQRGVARREPPSTVLTRVFTGKPARGLASSHGAKKWALKTDDHQRPLLDLDPDHSPGEGPDAARLPNAFNGVPLGRRLQKEALGVKPVRVDLLYMWAGGNWRDNRGEIGAGELVDLIGEELERALAVEFGT